MDRGASTEPLSWLLVPAAAVVLASALTLPLQPYTGIALRGDEVMSVDRGSPAARAGLEVGTRIQSSAPTRAVRSALAEARPGVPLLLTRERDGQREAVRIVPSALPAGERRMMAALLALASGFLLLGGWVWSERRDRLTRPFHLLCLAFATLLAPLPRLPWPAATSVHELLYTAATLALPALCIHFFAMFPETKTGGRLGAGTAGAYGIAAALFVAYVTSEAFGLAGLGSLPPLWAFLQAAAAIWFAAGLLIAVVLFARSYLRAATADARRRLRVALVGTALGLGPIATVTVVRNLTPGAAFPGERLAVMFVLLVPLSFAWATAIHRVFDFRVALRVAVVALAMTLGGTALYFAGELATARAPHGLDYGALALASLGLVAAAAGPARPGLRGLAEALLLLGDDRPLLEAVVADVAGGSHSREELLRRVCATLRSTLKLDRCVAVDFQAISAAWTAEDAPAGARLAPDFSDVLVGRSGPVAVDELALAPADRETLESQGVLWVVPVGSSPPAAVLLLGRRLAGAWLDRREVISLERCAQQLAVALENVSLRHTARSRGALDRELEEAGAFQAHLLPRRAPLHATLDCAAATLSSEAVGGDYYDFVEHPDRAFTLVVGDAAGHGVPAALLLAGVQAQYRSDAFRALEPGALLAALNSELARHDHPAKFVGFLCARVDVARGRIQFANAGLTPPMVRRRDGPWEEITVGGLLLGVRPHSSYPDARVQLRMGDLALIATDGLTEARRGDQLFGTDRVRCIVDRNAHRRASDIVQALVTAVREFSNAPMDDLTLVVLKQLADPVRTTETRRPPRGLKVAGLSADPLS